MSGTTDVRSSTRHHVIQFLSSLYIFRICLGTSFTLKPCVGKAADVRVYFNCYAYLLCLRGQTFEIIVQTSPYERITHASCTSII